MERKMNFSKPLPQYQCHKIVGALTIKSLENIHRARFSMEVKISFVEEGFDPILVPEEWTRQHKVAVGGMIVQYENEYVSFSPKRTFDNGYTLIDQPSSLTQDMFVEQHGEKV